MRVLRNDAETIHLVVRGQRMPSALIAFVVLLISIVVILMAASGPVDFRPIWVLYAGLGVLGTVALASLVHFLLWREEILATPQSLVVNRRGVVGQKRSLSGSSILVHEHKVDALFVSYGWTLMPAMHGWNATLYLRARVGEEEAIFAGYLTTPARRWLLERLLAMWEHGQGESDR
jgi:uncharacterized membrane protein